VESVPGKGSQRKSANGNGKLAKGKSSPCAPTLSAFKKPLTSLPLKGTLPYTFSSFPPAILIIRSASLKLNKSCSMKDYLMKLSVKSARTERRRKAEK